MLCCESRCADSPPLHRSANLCPSKTSIKCYYSTFSPNFPLLCKHGQKGSILVGKYYAFDNINMLLLILTVKSMENCYRHLWTKTCESQSLTKDQYLQLWRKRKTAKVSMQAYLKEQGMHMLSQAKTGQQQEAQGHSAQESSSPENAFDSQQGWRRRRKYLLCCGLNQGEVISSCFKQVFCHEVSADLCGKFIYGYWKKEKK